MRRFTIEEYLLVERRAETKSDYLNGEIFAMSGASRPHNLIGINLVGALYPQLAERDCELYSHDMRVRTPTDLFTYPDVAAVCGNPVLDDEEQDTLLNPVLIVEVLSKSTETYDRVTKMEHYRAIPSLVEIILFAQDRAHAEHWRRQEDGWWLVEEVDGLERTLALSSVGCELPLRAVYRKVLEDGS
jgi:Uma2 family endonuclease